MNRYTEIAAPAYILEEALLRKNLELMARVQREADVEIILAFKGFAMWSAFPLVRKYLSGATASSLLEARLCFEEMKTKAHTYAAAFRPTEFESIMRYSSHITFNSIAQYVRYRDQVANYEEPISCGIRVNPEYSEVETDLYNPCTPGSRLGASAEHFADGCPEGLEGLHFHALCESSSFELEKVLQNFERLFGHLLGSLKWVNMGGGHLMTRQGYDVAHLIQVLRNFKSKYPHLEVILEPGSAVAWQTGVLTSTVLDIVENKGVNTLMMDTSFTAHMPDCLEMPYRPKISGATDPVEGKFLYRIGGTSCLSGDYMDFYAFDKPVQIGDVLVFEDMIHYTMVKTTMFNGVHHPDIVILRENGVAEVIRKFSYEDYKNRLS